MNCSCRNLPHSLWGFLGDAQSCRKIIGGAAGDIPQAQRPFRTHHSGKHLIQSAVSSAGKNHIVILCVKEHRVGSVSRTTCKMYRNLITGQGKGLDHGIETVVKGHLPRPGIYNHQNFSALHAYTSFYCPAYALLLSEKQWKRLWEFTKYIQCIVSYTLSFCQFHSRGKKSRKNWEKDCNFLQ